MDIVIIGSGNVATVLGRKIKLAGHNILQIVSRNASEASKLAYEFDTESTNYRSLINTKADVYLIAVSDAGIPDVIENLRLPGKVVAHTAAAVPAEILKKVSAHYGVFYPLQTMRKETGNTGDFAIFFEGNDDTSKRVLENLAHSISHENVSEVTGDQRLKMHVAAVVVSNFVNHMYTLAESYCKKEGLDFKQLIPLIQETTRRLSEASPSESQTGPAIRHDAETITKHLAILESHPRLKELYELFTRDIQK